MKSYHLVSSQIVRSLVINDIVLFVVGGILAILNNKDTTLSIQITVITLILFSFILDCYRYRNAFVILKFDESGIHSKYLSIKWEEISSYTIMEPQARKIPSVATRYRRYRRKIKASSIVCIGNYNENKPFTKQNKRECIFFSLSQKQLSVINNLGKGKSAAIDQILKYHYSPNKHKT